MIEYDSMDEDDVYDYLSVLVILLYNLGLNKPDPKTGLKPLKCVKPGLHPPYIPQNPQTLVSHIFRSKTPKNP
jgi:hypothetical protein